MTESIFEPTAGHLICLALRGGQISVVDESKDKKVNLVLFLCCAIFPHTHVLIQSQQKRYFAGVVVNIFP
jgi:hypothetical protein